VDVERESFSGVDIDIELKLQLWMRRGQGHEEESPLILAFKVTKNGEFSPAK